MKKKKVVKKKQVKNYKPTSSQGGLRNNSEYLAFRDGGLQVTYFWRGPRPY